MERSAVAVKRFDFVLVVIRDLLLDFVKGNALNRILLLLRVVFQKILFRVIRHLTALLIEIKIHLFERLHSGKGQLLRDTLFYLLIGGSLTALNPLKLRKHRGSSLIRES